MVSIVETNEETTMQPWRPGVCPLTEFDIKIGKLSFSVRKDVLTRNHIAAAVEAADQAIADIMRQDHVRRFNQPGANRNYRI